MESTNYSQPSPSSSSAAHPIAYDQSHVPPGTDVPSTPTGHAGRSGGADPRTTAPCTTDRPLTGWHDRHAGIAARDQAPSVSGPRSALSPTETKEVSASSLSGEHALEANRPARTGAAGTPRPAQNAGSATLRPYVPCNSKEAARLLGLSRPAFDARRAKNTLWFEIGGSGTAVAVGARPRNRSADALPLVAICPPYLGVCLPGHDWLYDRYTLLATQEDPLEAVALVASGTPLLSDLVAQLLARMERTQ